VVAERSAALQSLLADLVRAADARYALAVACASNRLGRPCLRSHEDYLRGCTWAAPPGRAASATARRSLFSAGAGCGPACSGEMADYLYEEGCCAATVAAEERRWAEAVSMHPTLGRRFRVAWPGGGPPEEFRAADDCGGPAAAMDLACAAAGCGRSAGAGSFPASCCDGVLCANDGLKVKEGEEASGRSVGRAPAPSPTHRPEGFVPRARPFCWAGLPF
jgi:hypothetical protein